jgi:hypothetical protein
MGTLIIDAEVNFSTFKWKDADLEVRQLLLLDAGCFTKYLKTQLQI